MASRRKKLSSRGYGCPPITEIPKRNERHVDPEFGEDVVKQSNRAAKNIPRTDNMIARLKDRKAERQDCTHTRAGGNAILAAF